ncbi:MAG TPA: hypothetical protein VFA10_29135 [Ktedonobacteraceae bacterium]|nr:hypothetical protein [Ktedonobacteraceae bacterium]
MDRAGHTPPGGTFGTCISAPFSAPPNGTTAIENFMIAYTHAHGWLYRIAWQPTSRFWLFQGIESAIFFGLAAGLLALTYWWIRERIS